MSLNEIEVPRRFSNQAALEAFASNLNDEQFIQLCSVLKSRKWTAQEFADRVQPLRPDLDLTQVK